MAVSAAGQDEIRLPDGRVTLADPSHAGDSKYTNGDLKAQARTTITAVEPTLGLRLLGQRQASPGDIDLTLEVSNPATTPAAGVRLSQSVPNGLDVVGATGNGFFDQDNRTVACEQDLVRDHDLIKRSHTQGILNPDKRANDDQA